MAVSSFYHTSVWKKIAKFFGETVLFRREKWIPNGDYEKAVKTLKKGDLILVGLYTTLMGYVTQRYILNHAIYYCGDGFIIHSLKGGVQKNTLRWLCSYYDCFVAVRPSTKDHSLIAKADKIITSKLGCGYNYAMYLKEDKFTCTQLVNEGYLAAGYDTGLTSFRNRGILIDRYLPFLTLRNPIDFINGSKFNVVFATSNIRLDEEAICLTLGKQGAGERVMFGFASKIIVKKKNL